MLYLEFLKIHDIELFHFRVTGNKEPFHEIDQKEIASALVKVLDGIL